MVAGEEFLSPYTDDEQKHLGNVYFLTKARLSCQSIATGGDITVVLAPKRSPESRSSGKR